MPSWYEVYDDAAGLRVVQQRARRLTTAFGMAVLALLLLTPLVVLHLPGGRWLAGGALVALGLAGWVVRRRVQALRVVVWSVKLSFQEIVGDFGGRRAALPWPSVTRVDLDSDGLLVVGRDRDDAVRHLRIPSTFPDFSRLSHRVVDYAEVHGRPIYVDGQPWQLLDLHTLYPFLRDPANA